MTTRYICNKVGDPCLSKEATDDAEGFKGEGFCNNVCKEHVWKFTLVGLIRRTQRVVASGAYHSQGGLNLGHIKEMVMAMADHNDETLTETLGYDPESTSLWLYQDRKEWITKMKAYIIRSNGNSENESDNLSTETAALVRVIYSVKHPSTIQNISDILTPDKNGVMGQNVMQYLEHDDLNNLQVATNTSAKDSPLLYASRHTFEGFQSLFYGGVPLDDLRKHVNYVGGIHNLTELELVKQWLPNVARLGLEFLPLQEYDIPPQVTHLSINKPPDQKGEDGEPVYTKPVWVNLSYLKNVTHLYYDGTYWFIRAPPVGITHLFTGHRIRTLTFLHNHWRFPKLTHLDLYFNKYTEFNNISVSTSYLNNR